MTILVLLLATLAAPEPAPRDVPPPPEAGQSDSLRLKVGQMILVGFRGTSVDASHSVYRDIAISGVGGVILFDYDVPNRDYHRNIASAEQVGTLTDSLRAWADIPLLVAIDQEGGRVNRLKERYGFERTPSAGYIGATDDPDSTRFYAERTAKTLDRVGINLNFAPVVDLNLNPQNPIIGKIERSYGASPSDVTRHAAAVIEAHDRFGVLTALKHFPGHGSSTDDTHLGMVDVTSDWDESELEPYRLLVEAGLVRSVMTAHVVNRNLDPEGRSSTLSRPTVTGVLRDDIGFDGVVFSDDLQMGAIREHHDLETTVTQALEAGVDILTFGNNSVYEADIAERAIDIILSRVSDGTIPESRIDASFRRIMRLKSRLVTG